MKRKTWCYWLHYRTWGMTASLSSAAARNLRSWSRRNWMSEAGVSRSWTHNSTAHSYLSHHLDQLYDMLVSVDFYLSSSGFTAKNFESILPNKSLAIFCNDWGNDSILMLHILSLTTHLFIKQHQSFLSCYLCPLKVKWDWMNLSVQ